MNPLVKFTVSLLVATKKEEEGVFLAKCPFLNIVTQGPTERKAVENLKEEINFFFSSCCENNSLAAAMDHRTAVPREPYSTDNFVKVETTYVDVPDNIPPEVLRRIADAAVQVTQP